MNNMINEINDAEVILVTSMDEIIEYVIDKDIYTIIQTKDITGDITHDITEKCLQAGCIYSYQKDKHLHIDYIIENILNKILNNAFDEDCALYCLINGFEISLGYKTK